MLIWPLLPPLEWAGGADGADGTDGIDGGLEFELEPPPYIWAAQGVAASNPAVVQIRKAGRSVRLARRFMTNPRSMDGARDGYG